ncbi:MAG: hypothetical protein CL693_17535 [Cellvibrionaceae bacterium]|nr:hypothetical protein [Cellvibrionaceae bacterium]
MKGVFWLGDVRRPSTVVVAAEKLSDKLCGLMERRPHRAGNNWSVGSGRWQCAARERGTNDAGSSITVFYMNLLNKRGE